MTIARALLSGADLLLIGANCDCDIAMVGIVPHALKAYTRQYRIGNILDTLTDDHMSKVLTVLREMVDARGCAALATEYSRSPHTLKKYAVAHYRKSLHAITI